jgi:hypothetical protein
MAKTKKKATTETPTTAAPVKQREPGLHIIALQVENIKKVKCVRIRPANATGAVIISGKNGSGKSSVLDAIDYALCGTTNVPSQPVRKGQTFGVVEVDLGDYKVRRHFKPVLDGKKPYLATLEVFGRNREKFPNPQALLNGMMGAISFDPLAFIRLEPKEQVAMMRKLVKFDVDIDALEAEAKGFYDQRRDVGRDLESAKNILAAAPKPAADLPAVAIDTAAITHKLESAANHNNIIGQKEMAKVRLQDAANGDRQKIMANDEKIIALQQEIEGLRLLNGELVKIIKATEKQVAEMEIGEKIDTAAVAAELQAAQATNAAIQTATSYREKEKRVTELDAEWTKLDADHKAKVKARADAIAKAKMPIEGLSIGDGEVLYDGLPFEQASNAAQISISVAMAMAGAPKLRVMRIKDGSLLDNDTLALIGKLAAEEDYQVFIERVDSTGDVGVVMEDGEGSGAEVEQVK